jgi:hypothetical protein
MNAQTIPLTLMGKKGSNSLPMLEKLWDFYSTKGIKTSFVSLGTSSSPLGELEIIETLGCPIHIIEYNADKLILWEKVKKILTERKETEETICEFTADVVNKWVLPKNINISSSLLSTYSGTIELSGNTITTIDYNSYVESICSKMNIPNRIDLLNIQVGNDLEVSTILSLTNSSYRPGLIIVNYTNRPDTNIFTTQCAAHLQNIGYKLIQKEDNKFLYLYNDKNVYEYASYENTDVENPLIYELIKSTGVY